MSARKLSIEMSTTLPLSGGRVGRVLLVAGVADADAAPAPGGVPSEAAGVGGGTTGFSTGGVYFEQPATNAAVQTAETATRVGRDTRSTWPQRAAHGKFFRSAGLRFYGDLQLLADRQIVFADAVEHDFLRALFARNARGALGRPHDLRGDTQVVCEHEAGAVRRQVDPRHPLLQIEGASRLEQLGYRARENLSLNALKI